MVGLGLWTPSMDWEPTRARLIPPPPKCHEETPESPSPLTTAASGSPKHGNNSIYSAVPHQLLTRHNKNSIKTSIIPLTLKFKSIEQMERIRLKKSQEHESIWGCQEAAKCCGVTRWVTASGSSQVWGQSSSSPPGLLPDPTKKCSIPKKCFPGAAMARPEAQNTPELHRDTPNLCRALSFP